MEKPQVTDDSDSKQNFFSNFSSIVGKVANNATTVIKDKVNTSMIAEFNKEQEDFIKNKGKHWRSMGYKIPTELFVGRTETVSSRFPYFKKKCSV